MPELHWKGKEAAVVAARAVPYRPLIERPDLSHGDPAAGNLLIQGDNLDALKSLLPVHAGRVKCVFIDPPYNTRSAFEHYDDNYEHSTWLSLLYPRLELLHDLLADDGAIWVMIDDNERHYLKVIVDEIFNRNNFIASVVWVKTSSIHNNADYFSSSHDSILVYAKNIDRCRFGRIPRSARNSNDYSNPDNDPRGDWASSPLHVSLTSGQRGAQFAKTGTSSGLFPILSPHGKQVFPPKGRCWGYSLETINEYEKDKRIWWGAKGNNQPRLKRFLSEIKDGVVPTTVWGYEEVGHNQEAKKEVSALLIDQETELFSTPKPERLLQRILEIATNPGDLVLDSFLGSGTTAAVAHKMGRRWIGVELGDHAVTHCAPRLRKVIDGEQGGISAAVGWTGGGGFRFCALGDPIFDGHGSLRPGVAFADLARWIWYRQTRQPLTRIPDSPLIGSHDGTAYYLLFNGILGDRRPAAGNVLTLPLLAELPAHDGPRVVFGEACLVHESRLTALNLTFRQLPYQAC